MDESTDLPANILGWDIGGANLKAAHSSGAAASRAFELWRQPERLAQFMRSIAGEFDPADLWVVTMTGELCDCFASKEDGVRRILQSAGSAAQGRDILVWQTGGRFVDAVQACENYQQTAAANWHALATAVADQFCRDRSGLLIDVGSTTTDIVLLEQGLPRVAGLTDTQRLACGELVYAGTERTPVAMLVQSVPFHGRSCPVAREVFATTGDVYRVLGNLPQAPLCCVTADGQPATRINSSRRLARMVCADMSDCSVADIELMARSVASGHREVLTRAAADVLQRARQPVGLVVTAGAGDFLAQEMSAVLGVEATVSLRQHWGAEASNAACARALVDLARKRRQFKEHGLETSF